VGERWQTRMVDCELGDEAGTRGGRWSEACPVRADVLDHQLGSFRELRSHRVSIARNTPSLEYRADFQLLLHPSYEGLEQLWPVHMLIDYIRVYQDPKAKDLGCDPEDMPTASYIEMYKAAYTYVPWVRWRSALVSS
jgi:hypothetical protein